MKGTKPRVLCIEGVEDTLAFVTALLEGAGYEVVSAAGLDDVTRLLQVARYDLYLVAYKLEGGTGLEACRKLREVDGKTPIIFWTTRVFESDRRAALDAGASAFLRKPDDIEILVETATRLIE